MFQSLQGLLSGSSLTLSLTGNKDDTITVVVAPKGDGPLAQPLVVTATAAELDAEFHTVIASYVSARKGLADQIEATKAVIEAAKQKSASEAVTALTKKSSTGTKAKAERPESNDLDDDDGDGGSAQCGAPANQAPAADPLAGNLFA